MWKLYVLPEAAGDLPLELNDKLMLVGRAEDNILQIEDPNVSKHHALLVREDDAYLLFDLHSANGTYVNNARITSAALQDGDEVRFGPATFRVESGQRKIGLKIPGAAKPATPPPLPSLNTTGPKAPAVSKPIASAPPKPVAPAAPPPPPPVEEAADADLRETQEAPAAIQPKPVAAPAAPPVAPPAPPAPAPAKTSAPPPLAKPVVAPPADDTPKKKIGLKPAPTDSDSDEPKRERTLRLPSTMGGAQKLKFRR